MPYSVDQSALDNPNLTVLDIEKPPMRMIPHEEFPRMVYLHPKDKTKEHRTLLVHNAKDLANAEKQGYKLKAHVPEPPPDVALVSGEYEVA